MNVGDGAAAGGNGFEGGQEVPKIFYPGQSSTSVTSTTGTKPLTFLDRARLAKKQEAGLGTNTATNETVLNQISEENQKARADSVERKKDDKPPSMDLSVPNTFKPVEESKPLIHPGGSQVEANKPSGY